MSAPEQKPEDAFDASVLAIALGEALLSARRALQAQEDTCEDLANALRWTIQQTGKLSLRTPKLEITLKLRRMTRCVCHLAAPWDCPDAKDGQAVALEFYETSHYVEVIDKTMLPKGILKAVE